MLRSLVLIFFHSYSISQSEISHKNSDKLTPSPYLHIRNKVLMPMFLHLPLKSEYIVVGGTPALFAIAFIGLPVAFILSAIAAVGVIVRPPITICAKSAALLTAVTFFGGYALLISLMPHLIQRPRKRLSDVLKIERRCVILLYLLYCFFNRHFLTPLFLLAGQTLQGFMTTFDV